VLYPHVNLRIPGDPESNQYWKVKWLVEVVGHGILSISLADTRGQVRCRAMIVVLWCVMCVGQNGVKWIMCDEKPEGRICVGHMV